MRIAILGPYPLDNRINSIYGGVEAVIVNMLKGLSRFDDLDMHIVTANPYIYENIDFTSNGVNIHITAVPMDRRFGNLMLYSNTRRGLCGKLNQIKPDLVHTHMFGYYTLAAFDSGHKKVIVSTHGLSDNSRNLSCNIIEGMRQYTQDYIYYRGVKKAENIIVNSPYSRQRLARFNKTNIYELNNPVSDIYFDTDDSIEKKNRILFVGNISESKGIMTILRSLNILKDSFEGIKLTVAGHIVNHGFYSKIVRFIRDNGLDGYVDFLGHLNESGLKDEYKKASIFAFPSQKDVAPLALLQAMAAGKAIVATKVGGIPYIIDDGLNGFLIQDKDCDVLADRISLLLRDGGLRKRFGINARKKVLGEYRIDTVTDRLYGIYCEVLAN